MALPVQIVVDGLETLTQPILPNDTTTRRSRSQVSEVSNGCPSRLTLIAHGPFVSSNEYLSLEFTGNSARHLAKWVCKY